MQLLQKVKMLTDAPEGKNHALRGSKEKHFLYFAQISYFFLFSTALQKLPKIIICFPENKIS